MVYRSKSKGEWVAYCLTPVIITSGAMMRLAVAYTQRRLGADGAKGRLTLVQQRHKLASAIAAFYSEARRHLPSGVFIGDLATSADQSGLGAEWDDDLDGTSAGPASGSGSASESAFGSVFM